MFLDVVLRVGPRSTTLLRLTEETHNKWQLGQVTLGRVPQDFNILFQVSGMLEDNEYFAIDDIDFTNCFLPGKTPAQLEKKKQEGQEKKENIYSCAFICRAAAVLSGEHVPVQQQSVCGAQQDL